MSNKLLTSSLALITAGTLSASAQKKPKAVAMPPLQTPIIIELTNAQVRELCEKKPQIAKKHINSPIIKKELDRIESEKKRQAQQVEKERKSWKAKNIAGFTGTAILIGAGVAGAALYGRKKKSEEEKKEDWNSNVDYVGRHLREYRRVFNSFCVKDELFYTQDELGEVSHIKEEISQLIAICDLQGDFPAIVTRELGVYKKLLQSLLVQANKSKIQPNFFVDYMKRLNQLRADIEEIISHTQLPEVSEIMEALPGAEIESGDIISPVTSRGATLHPAYSIEASEAVERLLANKKSSKTPEGEQTAQDIVQDIYAKPSEGKATESREPLGFFDRIKLILSGALLGLDLVNRFTEKAHSILQRIEKILKNSNQIGDYSKEYLETIVQLEKELFSIYNKGNIDWKKVPKGIKLIANGIHETNKFLEQHAHENNKIIKEVEGLRADFEEIKALFETINTSNQPTTEKK